MKFRLPLIVCFFASFGTLARAQTTFTWLGTTSGIPALGSNWVGGIAPTGNGTENFVFGDTAGISILLMPVGTIGVRNITFNGTSRPQYDFNVVSAGAFFAVSGNLSLTGSTTNGVYFSSGLGIVLSNAFSSAHTIDVVANGYVDIAGSISESGANSMVKSGAGGLLLSGYNTFTGGMSVTGGRLYLGQDTATEGSFIYSGPVGTGTLTFSNGTTFSPALYHRTIANPIVLSSGTVNALLDTTFVDPYLIMFVLQTASMDLTGPISGAGRLSVTGPGWLGISASNPTWSGGLTVNADSGAYTYAADGTGTGSVTLAGSGATLELYSYNPTLYTLSGSTGSSLALYVEGSGTINVNQAADGTFAGMISGTGATSLVKLGAAALTLTGPNAYSGGTFLNAGKIAVLTLDNGGLPGSIGASSALAANLTFNGGTLEYTGAGSSTDRLFTVDSGGGTILASGSALAFTNPGAIAFATANSARTLTLGGTSTAANTFTPVLGDNGTGATSLIKSGTGTWLLAGANTFTGGLTITDGKLKLAASGALPATSIVTVSATSSSVPASFELNGFNQTVGGLVLGGATSTSTSNAVLTGGTLTLAPGGSVTYDGSTNNALGATISGGTLNLSGTTTFTTGGSSSTAAELTINSVITGSGAGLIKTGSGTLTLSQANTYNGATTINQGTLIVSSLANGSSASSLGASINSASNLVIDQGTLQYTGAAVSTDRLFTVGAAGASIDASGAGAMTWSNTGSIVLLNTFATRTLNLTGSNTGANTFSPLIGNTGGTGQMNLAKNGTGTWVLANANPFSGTTTLSAGTLVLGNTFALQGSTLDLAAGTLSFGSLSAATIGNISGSQNLSLTNASTNPVALTTGGNGASTTYTGVLSGAGSLVKTGTGTLTLSGSNTYTGATTIIAGTLSAFATNSLPTGTTVTTTTNGTLDVATSQTIGGLAGTGGSVVIAGTKVLTVSSSSDGGYGGVISGAGGFVKSGGADLTLSGISTLTGTATVRGGTLVLGGNNRLPTTNDITVNASTGGGARLDLAGFSQALGSLTIGGAGASPGAMDFVTIGGGGILSLNGALTYDPTSSPGDAIISGGSLNLPGSRTFSIGDSASSTTELTVSSTITGAGAIVKTGAGVLSLTGANTYAGGTAISGGTIVVGNANALGSGGITLNGGRLSPAAGISIANPISFGAGGGRLAGTGTFTSPMTIGSNTVLAPGNSAGTLTFSAGLTLASGASIAFEVQDATGAAGTGYDLLSVSGLLSGSGTSLDINASSAAPITIQLVSLNGGTAGNAANFNPAVSYVWTIASAANGISGFGSDKFVVDATGFTNGAAGGGFWVGASGTALELNFTPVPEPSTWAMMIAGACVLGTALGRRHRR